MYNISNREKAWVKQIYSKLYILQTLDIHTANFIQ